MKLVFLSNVFTCTIDANNHFCIFVLKFVFFLRSPRFYLHLKIKPINAQPLYRQTYANCVVLLGLISIDTLFKVKFVNQLLVKNLRRIS